MWSVAYSRNNSTPHSITSSSATLQVYDADIQTNDGTSIGQLSYRIIDVTMLRKQLQEGYWDFYKQLQGGSWDFHKLFNISKRGGDVSAVAYVDL